MSSTRTLPEPRPAIMDIAAYVPGRKSAPGAAKVHKLSSNESPLGSSPEAVRAASDVLSGLAAYPDGNATALCDAIADVHGLNPANIMCGNGSDELLALLCQAYLSAGDEGIVTEHGFLIYKIQITAAGATPITVPEIDCQVSVDAILDAVTERTKIVFVANPNNPTGTYLPIEEVRRLRSGLPDGVLLVLDGAYAEYVRRNDYESGIELVSDNDNVVMTRTFSKIHGLAGLRIGWMYGPRHVLDVLHRIRGPFNLNAAAIAAGVAAIRDRAHVDRAIEHNEVWMRKVTEGLEAMGLKVTPSVANFVLIHFDGMGDKTATKADEFLVQRGFVLRHVSSYGFPNALRLSIGSQEANEGVLAALREFLDAS